MSVSSFVMFSVDFTHFEFRTSESRPLADLFVDNDAKNFKPMTILDAYYWRAFSRINVNIVYTFYLL